MLSVFLLLLKYYHIVYGFVLSLQGQVVHQLPMSVYFVKIIRYFVCHLRYFHHWQRELVNLRTCSLYKATQSQFLARLETSSCLLEDPTILAAGLFRWCWCITVKLNYTFNDNYLLRINNKIVWNVSNLVKDWKLYMFLEICIGYSLINPGGSGHQHKYRSWLSSAATIKI